MLDNDIRHLKVADATLPIIIGFIAGGGCLYFRQTLAPGPGDFNWALIIAKDLLAGRDPYNFTPSALKVPYPLPVAVFGLPFIWLPDAVAAAIFFGSTSAFLAYAMLRYDAPWRLLTFLSFPFVYALMFAQWSPLIMAAWFFPAFAPVLVLVKPQLALPVAISKYSRTGVVVAIGVLILSILVYPTWPIRWLSMTKHYDYVIPMLTLPFGPLLMLAFLRLKDPKGRLLACMSLLPFRGAYDLVPLWIIPQTKLRMTLFLCLSWIVPILDLPTAFWVGVTWPVLVLFIPALTYVFWQSTTDHQEGT
jgi:hypothetical protein